MNENFEQSESLQYQEAYNWVDKKDVLLIKIPINIKDCSNHVYTLIHKALYDDIPSRKASLYTINWNKEIKKPEKTLLTEDEKAEMLDREQIMIWFFFEYKNETIKIIPRYYETKKLEVIKREICAVHTKLFIELRDIELNKRCAKNLLEELK